MDTKARWIWCKSQYEKNEYAEFKKNFVLKKADSTAKIYISADTKYALWINGSFVCCGGYEDYPEKKHYDTYAVGEYLKTGENMIFVSAYYQGESSLHYAVGQRGFWFCLENGAEHIISDETSLARISNTYQNGDMMKITWQLGYSFAYDARGENNPAAWEHAEVQDKEPPSLARPIRNLVLSGTAPSRVIAQGVFRRAEQSGTLADKMQHDFLSSRLFEEIFDGTTGFPLTAKKVYDDGFYVIVDLGEETSGYFTLKLSASEGTQIDIAYGEHLNDMRVRSKIGDRNFVVSYICREGEQEFTQWHGRMGARYLQLHVSGYRYITLERVSLISAAYPAKVILNYSDENDHRRKLFDTCIRTLRLCMHEHYEDCPWREQGLYAFDSRNQMLFGNVVFEAKEYARACIDLLGQRFGDNCQINICAPTSTELFIPSFTLWWILELKEYTELSGDLSLAKQYWEQVMRIVRNGEKSMKNSVAQPPNGKVFDGSADNAYFHHYEWSSGYEGMNQDLLALYGSENFYEGMYPLIFLIVLEATRWIAEQLGKHKESAELFSLYRRSVASYKQMFWDEDTGAFASFLYQGKRFHYGEYVQSLALYSGICDEHQASVLYEKLLHGSELQEITISYSIFKYEALVKQNPACAGELYRSIEQKWSEMLYQGATSFWETILGEADFDGAGSLCHGWSALPIYFYYKYVKKQG